jgi:beta-galactosidase
VTDRSTDRSAGRSIELRDRRIWLDGAPGLFLGGEVHYFRLARSLWRERLQQLKDAGCNTLATYVPWLWHELSDGSVDLTGRTHEQRDLAGFLDLAHEMGLFVVARPGPFIMAEIKNEGVPYRVYDAPGVLPTTWDGATIPTRTADYLSPAFLDATRGWYAEVMPVIAERLLPSGGNVIAVQLDNEIGMLSWVTNSPDLTDVVCEDLRGWAIDRWGAEEAGRRTGTDALDAAAFASALRTPAEAVSLPLHHALGLYMRARFRRYVVLLREEAERHGVDRVPFLVNVHGTAGGRGRTYPIGLSQLLETWRGQPQMTAGSDLYLGDLTVENVPDLYIANAFGAAVQGDDQPLTSLEFEAGTGDYGEDLSRLSPPEAVELKTRLCLAQGNRLINVYLFAGGHNPPLEVPAHDGNDRIAFTGERHGFAAPVGPDGQESATYGSTRRAMTSTHGVADLIADMDQVYDGLALGFVPDHYLTEYQHPASASRAEQVSDLERFRGMGPRDVLVRAMVLGGYSFPAVDLQQGEPGGSGNDLDIDPEAVPVLALASATTLSGHVQARLARYVAAGGRLLLNGLLPARDQDGNPCSVLADALDITVSGRVDGSLHYYPSVVPHGWAAPGPEVRTGYAQLLSAREGRPVLTEVGSDQPCAVEVDHGAGRAVVIACDYPCHLDFWRAALAAVGVRRRWVADADAPGLVVTPTANANGEQLLHLVHVGPTPVSFTLAHEGTPFLDGRTLTMPARSVLTLPVGIALDGGRLLASTAELVSRTPGEITLRGSQTAMVEDLVVLDTELEVSTERGTVAREGRRVVVTFGRDNRRPAEPALSRLRLA